MKELFNEMIRVNSIEHDVIYHTMKAFKLLRVVAQKTEEEFMVSYPENNLEFNVRKNSDYVFEITFGSDVLAFIVHTNVHVFPKNHEVMRLPYVTEDKSRSYCGIIDIYNFLTDSFKYKRMADIGALLGRVFVNKEGHFFVEGSRELGGILSRFNIDQFSEETAKRIIKASIEFALHFDLQIPTIEDVCSMTLDDFTSYRDKMQLRTGKKIGFDQ